MEPLDVDHKKMETKQVIVVRKDLKMRRGKEIAQGSHASMSFLTRTMMFSDDIPCMASEPQYEGISYLYDKGFFDEVQHWTEHSFKKICVCVESEEELDEIHRKALSAGLISHMITDNGLTEFHGVPTKTCLGIGPHEISKFEGITDHLKLY